MGYHDIISHVHKYVHNTAYTNVHAQCESAHVVHVYMYVHVAFDLTDLHMGLGKVTGVWGDGSIGATSVRQRELVQ